jgi:hypothetical protein
MDMETDILHGGGSGNNLEREVCLEEESSSDLYPDSHVGRNRAECPELHYTGLCQGIAVRSRGIPPIWHNNSRGGYTHSELLDERGKILGILE